MYSTAIARAAPRALLRRKAPASLPTTSRYLRLSPAIRWYAKDTRPASLLRQSNAATSGSSSSGQSRNLEQGQKDQTWQPGDPIKFGAAGVAAAGATSSSNSRPSLESELEAAELDTEADPSRNTAPRNPGAGPGITGSVSSVPSGSGSEAQAAEFDTEADPAQNTAPRNPGAGPGLPNTYSSVKSDTGSDVQAAELERQATPSKIDQGQQSAVDATFTGSPHNSQESETQTRNASNEQHTPPLPDLRQGIPSTFSVEFNKTPSADTSNESETTNLNITEDPREAPTAAGGGRKGGGDLPKTAYVSSFEKRRERIANYMYASFFGLLVVGTIYLGRNWDSEEEERAHPEAPNGWALGPFYRRCRARLSGQLGYYTEPAFPKLLPDMDPSLRPPYTLVLSLEDLLVHGDWNRKDGWRVAKRPGVDYFIRYLQQYYELVIFTSVPMMTADPIIRKLDPYRIIMWPLFREATKYQGGEYIKDLSYLNRDLSKVIIIDTNKSHVKLQPENAIILDKWKGDPKDKELVSLIPFLEYVGTMGVEDTRQVLKSFEGKHIPTEFAEREKKIREKFEKELAEERMKRPKRSGAGFLGKTLGITPTTMGHDPGEQTAAQAFEQGKMLLDQVRERGQKQYEILEKEIRENGAKWLAEMAAEEKKAQEEQMKSMKSGFTGWFGAGNK